MIVKLPTMVSVAGMARLVGLSRQRFHQLMREGVFPPPIYDAATKRPHYTEDMQQICMNVREKNVGVNGRVVLFYVRRPESAPKKQISSFGSARPKKLHHRTLSTA